MRAGEDTDVTIKLNTENPIPANGKIKVAFPEGFTLKEGLELEGTPTNFPGTVQVTASESEERTLILKSDTATAAGAIIIKVKTMTNPSGAGSHGGITITTTDEGGGEIGSCTASQPIVISLAGTLL